MNHKERYKKAIDQGYSVPVFSRPWWLDCVCGSENWDVCIIEQNNAVVASLPYYLFSKATITLSRMPSLTQFLGPTIVYPENQKPTTRLSYEKDLYTSLIEQLPKFPVFDQSFSPAISNWLPFYWKKFNQTTYYTYIIKDLSDIDKVFGDFRSNIKTDIRKAKKSIVVQETDSFDEFLPVHHKTFERQGKKLPYSINFIKKLDKSCIENKSRKIYIAKDQDGITHAGVYLVWDDTYVYYLLSGSDPKYRKSGALSLLLWEAIQFAAKEEKMFNFEGSMIEPIERHFRAFGGKQTPYFRVQRYRHWFYKAMYLDFLPFVKKIMT